MNFLRSARIVRLDRFILLVRQSHGLRRKCTDDHCNPAEVYRNAPKIAAKSNASEMLAHNLNSVRFVTIEQLRPFSDRPFARNGFYIMFSFDLQHIVKLTQTVTKKKTRKTPKMFSDLTKSLNRECGANKSHLVRTHKYLWINFTGHRNGNEVHGRLIGFAITCNANKLPIQLRLHHKHTSSCSMRTIFYM